ncbi:unnamed protein product (macronuclear) [Paramecium tetraurelia]|uniref:Uncharacterized protein n=1 Tax=Paramecium tetraurelia TaxID=5888 RepID=A0BI65_PARTE|nr:uncharacterized protein GSPATT00029268001 [Paramecium tetraurelia]CAK58232.1 unnamed protein product [Paramecium tetraurelia]|eukprot:XP_001425630.1 hypothetical protein (macronuclear) [Paramecium tetraurelia strain d4-2]
MQHSNEADFMKDEFNYQFTQQYTEQEMLEIIIQQQGILDIFDELVVINVEAHAEKKQPKLCERRMKKIKKTSKFTAQLQGIRNINSGCAKLFKMKLNNDRTIYQLKQISKY